MILFPFSIIWMLASFFTYYGTTRHINLPDTNDGGIAHAN
jgi:hypothetical protein